eukprot:1261346-Rhodomonas_salina.2
MMISGITYQHSPVQYRVLRLFQYQASRGSGVGDSGAHLQGGVLATTDNLARYHLVPAYATSVLDSCNLIPSGTVIRGASTDRTDTKIYNSEQIPQSTTQYRFQPTIPSRESRG